MCMAAVVFKTYVNESRVVFQTYVNESRIPPTIPVSIDHMDNLTFGSDILLIVAHALHQSL